ncbi:MAG: AsnC family transcriptional regulator [Crenarchaeota archaeon]|nr:MAG: AsnC family transcriptional regulator [Thermoproteota archaeon]RDJ33988.1 MAG: AsnC family transcriptional regulator [Thermoproteota archaeon]RDJ36897.1 MAG: AsnC family transcriptional regulator [Thermoproteota archaeon]RDJ37926.1 MAG: AsnC family transcriptional regulator [Thermoproteota archaeon]
MTHELDETDVAIIKSLMEDGRKSFRQISRELKISTPTVKFRYQRLVNVGLIKSVVPLIDASKLQKKQLTKLERVHTETDVPNVDFSKKMSVKMVCDLCEGPVGKKPTVLKFANIERFFCCSSCKSLYKEKYRGRIEALIKKSP